MAAPEVTRVAGKTVLVVDDEPQVLSLFAEALSRHGYHTCVARNCEVALEQLDQGDPQVVFLDLKLPGPDGVQIFERIRERRPTIPVVIITGYPRESLVEAAIKLGAFACLIKPFSMGDVLGILDALDLETAA